MVDECSNATHSLFLRRDQITVRIPAEGIHVLDPEAGNLVAVGKRPL